MGISLKGNGIAQLEFELSYTDDAIQYVSKCTTESYSRRTSKIVFTMLYVTNSKSQMIYLSKPQRQFLDILNRKK